MVRRAKPQAKATRRTKSLSSVSAHSPGRGTRRRAKSDDREIITAAVIVRRTPKGRALKDMEYFVTTPPSRRARLTREDFEKWHGAAPADLERVAEYAREHQLQVIEINSPKRVIRIQGTVAQFNAAFGIKCYEYEGRHGTYRGYEGAAKLPTPLSKIVETIIGIDNRPLPAKHQVADPTPIGQLLPQTVANLYRFPSGGGKGETIGIYEMVTGTSTPGYTAGDLFATMNGFGATLVAPSPTDISVNGQSNTGTPDIETTLDICIASAIAQAAGIAVYFTTNDVHGILECLQRMIHPGVGDPVPTVISISYRWAPDDDTDFLSDNDFEQLSSLFQDAANLGITVLTSSGDTGAEYADPKVAQAQYPATDPWILTCGGTSVGNITTTNFDEFVWNDSWTLAGGKGTAKGATGGGISARFAVPAYQKALTLPNALKTKKPGRGIPDVAGNASPNSGYSITVSGTKRGEGGTSAVAPLYAGLIAIVNSILLQAGALYRVGFANPSIYQNSSTVCRDVTAASGPANNDFDSVSGYPAGTGWDACTGLGSLIGEELLNVIRPLGATIHRRSFDGCDPGPVTGQTATFDVKVTGGYSGLTYKWAVTNASAVGPVGPKPWLVNLGASYITIDVPPANTVFELSVQVKAPFGATVTADQKFKSLDPAMAGLMNSLCRLIHEVLEFRPPIYVPPGDPYLPEELERINSLSNRIANLSGRIIELQRSRTNQ